MSNNLARLLTETAERQPDRPALRLDDNVLTYSQLDDATARCAGLLQEKGLKPGDRVGIMLPNVPYFGVAYYGALRAGCTIVPMNVLLKGRETTFYLQDPEAKAVFAWGDAVDAAREGAEAAGAECIPVEQGEFEKLLADTDPAEGLADVDGNDTAVLLYTSGTTGTPKGAELTHDNMYSNARVCADLYGSEPDDVVLGALPLFHAFGQTCALNTTMYAGGSLTMLPRFDADKALEIIERDKVTIFEGVPTMFSGMLHAKTADSADTSSLRICVSGGSPIPVEVMRSFEEKFGTTILEGYGLSETSPVASFNHPDKERKAGSIGTPVEGVSMKVVDDDGNEQPQGEPGEIWISGHNVMKGYWNRQDATDEVLKDGWFATGDVATVDEDGYFFIVDRKKDLIIRGGYNVYPREIEEVLYEHPAVREAAVIAVPHDSLGEEVGAAVVLKEGEDASTDDLKSFVKEKVAGYKYPRVVWIAEDLPKGPTGKILKREIELPDDVKGASK